MITLENNFFETKPWGRQSDTVHLFMFLLSRADDRGEIDINIQGMQKGMGICCLRKVKFCLRQLELSGNLTMQKIEGKKIYTISTNTNDTKIKDARNADENAAGTKTGGLPHAIIKW